MRRGDTGVTWGDTRVTDGGGREVIRRYVIPGAAALAYIGLRLCLLSTPVSSHRGEKAHIKLLVKNIKTEEIEKWGTQ